MSTNQPIRILVVDDHPIVREGIAAIVSSEQDMEVVGEAGSVSEALKAYRELRPNILLVDLLLPDGNGTKILESICSRATDVRVIVLTTVAGDADIYRALEFGARGYLFKDMVRKELTQAIRAVHGGRRYIPPQVGARLAEHLPRVDLTGREVNVLQLVAAGRRNKEIAYELGISEATVNAHVKHILEKLNATDRTHAVTTALRRGVIKL